MSDVMVNLTPTTDAFYAEHRRNIGVMNALRELLDNSFDAGASLITLSLLAKQQTVKVEDNGSGCDNLNAFVSQGTRQEHSTTESGRYGVGVKAAALYFWGCYEIETRRHEALRRAVIDWDEIVRFGNMTLNGQCEPTQLPSGTVLTFRDIPEDRANKLKACEKWKRELVEWFWPALKGGRRIQLVTDTGTSELSPPAEPELRERIELSGDVDGLKWDGYAGLMLNENPKPGFTLVKAHRVVTRQFNDVLAEYKAPQFYAVIFLRSKEWQLTALKDDLADEAAREKLNEQLEDQCRAILEKAAVASQSEFYDGLNDELNEVLFGRKRYRNPPSNRTGTIKPKDSDRKRNAKEKANDGSNPGKQTGATVEIVPYEGNGKLGYVEATKSKSRRKAYKIYININRSDVAEAQNRQDRTVMKMLTMSLLAGFISCSESEDEARQLLLGSVDSESKVDTYNAILGRWFPKIAGGKQTL